MESMIMRFSGKSSKEIDEIVNWLWAYYQLVSIKQAKNKKWKRRK